MDDYIIPRISVFLSDMAIWTDLDRFSDLTGYVPEATSITAIQDPLEKVVTCHGFQSRASSQMTDTLFDKNVHDAWKREKGNIKKLMKKHRAMITDLQRLQEKCLTFNNNVAKHATAIALQKSSVKPVTVTEECNIADIEEMESECEWEILKQARYYERFQNTLEKENTYREKLRKLSSSLAADIANKMAGAISRLMRETHQTTSVTEAERLAWNILKTTSRLYNSKTPTRLPCGQDKITAPRLYENQGGNTGAVLVEVRTRTSRAMRVPERAVAISQ